MSVIDPERDLRWEDMYATRKMITPRDELDGNLPEGFWVGCILFKIEVVYLGRVFVARYYFDPRYELESMEKFIWYNLIDRLDEEFKNFRPLVHSGYNPGCRESRDAVDMRTTRAEFITCPECKEGIKTKWSR